MRDLVSLEVAENLLSMGLGKKCEAGLSFLARMPFMHFPLELIPKCHGRYGKKGSFVDILIAFTFVSGCLY